MESASRAIDCYIPWKWGEISPLVEWSSVARPQKGPCQPKLALGGIHAVSITLHLVAIAAWR